MIPRKVFRGAGAEFELVRQLVSAGASSGNVRTFNSRSLGDPSPTRVAFVKIHSRTNSTTGDRRWTAAKLVVGGVDYNGTVVEESSSSVAVSPSAIWQIPIPVGTVGNLVLSISGNSNGVVAEHITMYVCKGRFEVFDTGYGSTGCTISTTSKGYLIHGAYGAGTTPLGVPSRAYTVQDQHYSYDSGVLRVRDGRMFPNITETFSINVSDSSRNIALALRIR